MADSSVSTDDGLQYEDSKGFLLPHYRTFSAIYNIVSKTYRYTWDEALRHSEQNSLAMPRDAFLMGCLHERILQLAELPWHLEPEDQKDQRQVMETKELRHIIQATPRWIQFATQMGWATWYGRYGTQHNWRAARVNGKQRLCSIDHTPVNGDKIQFGWDGVPRVYVSHMWIWEQGQDRGRKMFENGLIDNYPEEWLKRFPERDALMNKDPARPVIIGDRAPMLVLRDPAWRERFVIHKHMCLDADFFDGEMAGGVHGVGLRSMIYWFFHLRDEMIGWALNHLKKIGVGGILIFYYEEGNKEAQLAAENAAKDAGERYALAMPKPRGSSKDVEGAQLLPFSEAGVASIKEMVADYFERHIERLMIGQTLSSKPAGGGLGDGTATLHSDTKFRILKFDALNLGDTLSEDFVRVAQKWNFPRSDYRVKFVFDIPDPEGKEKIANASAIFQMGGAVKSDGIYGAAGLDVPEEDDKVLSQAQMQKDQAESQGAAQQAQGQAQLQQKQQEMQLEQQKAQQQQHAEVQKHKMGLQHADETHQQKMKHQAAAASQKQAEQANGAESWSEGIPPLNLPPLPPNQQIVAMQEEDEVETYAAQHAPKGGATIAGHRFVGGQFIPSAVMAKATPQERAKLEQRQQAEQAPAQPQALPQQVPPEQVPQEQAPPQAPTQMVPDEQLNDLLSFASSRTIQGKEHHLPHVLDSVRRIAKLAPHDYASAAGRAYQRSAAAAALGQVTQDTYDANAFRVVEKYRHQQGKMIGNKTQLQPVSKAAQAAAGEAGRFAGAVANPVLKHVIGQQSRPFFGPVSKKTGEFKRDVDPLAKAVHRVGTNVSSNLASKGISQAVGDVPHFIHWLRQGMPKEGRGRAITTGAKLGLATGLSAMMARALYKRGQKINQEKIKQARRAARRPRGMNIGGMSMSQEQEVPTAYMAELEDALVERLTDEVVSQLEVG